VVDVMQVVEEDIQDVVEVVDIQNNHIEIDHMMDEMMLAQLMKQQLLEFLLMDYRNLRLKNKYKIIKI
jgi:hypothetical protein